jgi:hypothetical protein
MKGVSMIEISKMRKNGTIYNVAREKRRKRIEWGKKRRKRELKVLSLEECILEKRANGRNKI